MRICKTNDVRQTDLRQHLGDKPGIYCWHNTHSDMWYIGSAGQSISERTDRRIHALNTNRCDNKRLTKDWNDEHVFEVSVLTICDDPDQLEILEHQWIQKFETEKRSMYNVNRLAKDVVIKSPEHAMGRVKRKCTENLITGCWEANYLKPGKGYGNIDYLGQTGLQLHRLAFKAANPDVNMLGKVVRHLCGNRACCNPAHLKLGSHLENMHDSAKRFEAFGEESKTIMEWLSDPRCVKIQRVTLQNRINIIKWNVEKALTTPVRHMKRPVATVGLTPEIEAQIIQMYAHGHKSKAQIGRACNVSATTVFRVLKKVTV